MKKVVSVLLISLATLALVGVWAQSKSVTVMTDNELKAAIDSLVEVEQPLTAAPLIAEAKKRAESKHDTRWMLDIIQKDVKLNGRRLFRESSAADMLKSCREKAWTPLRQALSAEIFSLTDDEADAFDAISESAELRKIKASDIYDGVPDVNLLDYLATSLSVLHKYDVQRISNQGQVKAFNAPYKDFAASTDSLPFPAAAARLMTREAVKAADSESVVVAQSLRVLLASCSKPLALDSLLSELMTMRPKGFFASNLVLFAKASALLSRLSPAGGNVSADNAMIAEASDLLSKVKAANEASADSSCAWMAACAREEIDRINRTEIYVKAEAQVMPNKYTPLLLSYRNIGQATVNVYRVASSISNSSASVNLEKIVASQKPVLSKSLSLPPTRSRAFLSSSYVELDGLDCGYYLLTASSEEGKPLACATFFSSAISPKLVSVGSKDFLQISDFESGAPMPDVKVGKTSSPAKDGWMQWRNEGGKLSITRKGDSFFADSYSYSTRGEWNRPDELAVQFISDRRIYRPGQSLLFKVYFYDRFTDHVEPLEDGRKCLVQLYGANGKELTKANLRLDEFGAASGQLDIPADAMKGSCRVVASCGKARGAFAVQVEDFKRADNSVVISPFDDVVIPGSEAIVKGSCTSAAGLPVSNAKVVYEISGDDQTLAGECITESDGSFSFSFKAEEKNYDILVRVTDAKGETADASKLLRVFPAGYDVSLSLRKPQSVVGSGPVLSILSLNSNGRPYRSKVRLSITPYEPEANLRPALTGDVDTVISEHCSVVFGTADFSLNNVKLSPTTVHDRVYDVNGRCDVDLSSLNLPARRYKIVAEAIALDSTRIEVHSDYVSLADKGRMDGLSYLMLDAPASVKADSALSFRVGTGLNDAYVTVLVSKAGKIAMRKQVRLSHSVNKVDFNVPDDCVNGEMLKVVAFVQKDGASYTRSAEVRVQKEESQLTLALSSFRDHSVPGAKETWTVTCLGPVVRAVAASMYDSRLDKYIDNSWNATFDRLPVQNRLMFGNVYPRNYGVSTDGTDVNEGYFTRNGFNTNSLLICDVLDKLRYFLPDYYMFGALGGNFALYETCTVPSLAVRGARRMNKSAAMASADVENDELVVSEESADAEPDGDSYDEEIEPMRENFDETVFFLPSLTPDSDGKVTFEFTLPDNLTTYNFRALAVDKDMRYASLTRTLTVAKPLNVQIGLPRFATEGDSLFIPVSVTSTDSAVSSAKVSIKISDNATKRVLRSQDIGVEVGGAKSVRTGCGFVVPEGVETLAIEARSTTSAGSSDGERKLVPVAKRNIEVLESSSFALTSKGVHKLANPFTDGKTKTLTFNYTSNAFIEVLRALPTLDNTFTPCADTYLGRYESSSIASLIQKRPDIQKAVKYLRDNDGKMNTIGDADSNIWYLVAQRLAKHDKEVAKLLSGSYAARVKAENLRKLSNMQLSDGSFPWFSGMDGSDFMTVAVVSTLGQMQMLGLVEEDDMPEVSKIIKKAKPYISALLDKSLKNYDSQVKDGNQPQRFTSFALYTLQARVLMGGYSSDRTVSRMLDILKQKWQYPVMCDRVTALFVLTHAGETAAASTVLKSIEENLVQTKDGTAYIPENGLFHRREQVEAQAMLVIALQRLNANSRNAQKVINHLILMKRGEAWPDAQSTSRAVLALLASSYSATETDVVEVGDVSATCSVEKPEVSFALAADGQVNKAKVQKSGNTTSWGSWERVMKSPIDELQPSGDSKLNVARSIEVRCIEAGKEVWKPVSQAESLSVGDQVRVSLKFYNDEPLSFVRIRDFRTAAAEPDDKLSGYRGWWFWRRTDANVSTPNHYMSISDDKTEFFIDYLYEGWHSVSYTATITHSGDFAAGYADAQCMYATEIMAHSEGVRLSVVQ